MDSGRESLFAQVKTDLEGIRSGTGLYTNTVREVSRDLRTPSQLQLPAIVMVEGGDKANRYASGQVHVRDVFVQLIAYLNMRGSSDSASTLINSLAADIKVAMASSTNYTHGGNCHLTFLEDMDPLAVGDAEIVGLVMQYRHVMSHTWDVP